MDEENYLNSLNEKIESFEKLYFEAVEKENILKEIEKIIKEKDKDNSFMP